MTETSPCAATAAHKASAREFYLQNSAMNAAKKNSEAERKALFASLEEAGIDWFDFETKDAEGNRLRLAVQVMTPVTDSIDVELLRDLVDEPTFLRIVSASKKAVEEHADKSIAVLATVSGNGTRNVTVKPAA
jgi:hypothetical protein